MSHRRAALGVTVTVSATMLINTQFEWVRSGSAGRNSYQMFRSAQRLGLDQLTPFRVIWFLLPVLILGSVLMAGLARYQLTAVFLGAASLVSLGVGIAVLSSGLAAGPGAPLATAAGVIGSLAALAIVVDTRRSVARRASSSTPSASLR